MLDPDDETLEPPEDDLRRELDQAKALVDAGKTRPLPPEWARGGPLNEKGTLCRTLGGVVWALEHHPDVRGCLAYDERRQTPLATRQTAWGRPGDLRDAWVTELRLWLEQQALLPVGHELVHQAVLMVAERTPVDAVRQYLEGLSWDGQHRLSRLLIDHCQAPDEVIIEQMTRAWCISAVQRALRPGCQADHVLTLEGSQGVGKTSLLRLLAGEGHHLELAGVVGDEVLKKLQGPWLVELGELTAVGRVEAEALKQFLTTTHDVYRPSYARLVVRSPRRVVFAGTTNQAQYLRDATGGRRWWPVPVGVVDLAAIGELRDQVWAEAVVAARAGEPHWLRGQAVEASQALQASRQVVDPWADILEAHVAQQSEPGRPQLTQMTSAEIWAAVGTPSERQSSRDWQRIGAIMRGLGWVPYRSRAERGYRLPGDETT